MLRASLGRLQMMQTRTIPVSVRLRQVDAGFISLFTLGLCCCWCCLSLNDCILPSLTLMMMRMLMMIRKVTGITPVAKSLVQWVQQQIQFSFCLRVVIRKSTLPKLKTSSTSKNFGILMRIAKMSPGKINVRRWTNEEVLILCLLYKRGRKTARNLSIAMLRIRKVSHDIDMFFTGFQKYGNKQIQIK